MANEEIKKEGAEMETNQQESTLAKIKSLGTRSKKEANGKKKKNDDDYLELEIGYQKSKPQRNSHDIER